jgi:hypothetical protein
VDDEELGHPAPDQVERDNSEQAQAEGAGHGVVAAV